MSRCSKTFDPVKCYEQLRSNMLADPHYSSQGQYMLHHQGMGCWLAHLETLNSQLAREATTIEAITMTPSPQRLADAGLQSRLNPLLADIILTIYRGGL